MVFYFHAHCQALTVTQLSNSLHKDASQLNNYLTINGWNYYQSIDSLGVNGLIFGYNIQRYENGDRADMWLDAFYKNGNMYSIKIIFGSHALYAKYLNALMALKVKNIHEKTVKYGISTFYSDSKHIYVLSSISKENQLPFGFEIQPND